MGISSQDGELVALVTRSDLKKAGLRDTASERDGGWTAAAAVLEAVSSVKMVKGLVMVINRAAQGSDHWTGLQVLLPTASNDEVASLSH